MEFAKDSLIDKEIYLPCPNCGDIFMTIESEINCTIYRHAILKSNMEQINPHSSKEECERLIAKDLVYGCAKPFRIIKKENILNNSNNVEYEAIICEYI